MDNGMQHAANNDVVRLLIHRKRTADTLSFRKDEREVVQAVGIADRRGNHSLGNKRFLPLRCSSQIFGN
jgi:hypothetical protein